MSVQPAPDRMERFERKIVFRTARGYFLLLAFLAVLGVIAGVAIGTKGVIKVPIDPPVEPTLPPPPPAPPSITRAALEKWFAERESRRAAEAAERARSVALYAESDDSGSAHAGGAEATERERERAEIRRLFDLLPTLFPAPTYVWEDVTESYCATPSSYTCLETRTRVVKAGIGASISGLLRKLERAESLRVLTLWHAILPAFAVEDRVTWAGHLIEAARDFKSDADSVMSTWESEVARIRHDYDSKVSAHARAIAERDARREQERTWGIYGVAGGLVLMILVSIFLVHFAIERHLRLMREVADLLRGSTT
jgi:hypothetical protein